jgi:uncharacterized protein YbcI
MPKGFDRVGFFCRRRRPDGLNRGRTQQGNMMVPTTRDEFKAPTLSMAQQIARAAIEFEHQTTGHVPKSVTVVLSDNTLVITLHGALSPAERALAMNPEGAAQVQEFHRQLFANASDALRQEIKRITGVEVREATAEVETTTGVVVKVFTSGTVVQVFLLARSVPAETWSGDGSANP